jgi:PAS domain S-box-containing protein
VWLAVPHNAIGSTAPGNPAHPATRPPGERAEKGGLEADEPARLDAVAGEGETPRGELSMANANERTDRARRARRARAERQLAVVQEITHIGTWEWDVRTNAVTWSDEMFRIYGLERGKCELSLEFFLSRLHPDDRERVHGEVSRALEGGTSFAYRERIVRPDGMVRELDTAGEVERDASGHALGLLGTCRDITEERLRDETIELYADIVRNATIGLAVLDVGDPNDARSIRLVAYNPAAEVTARRSLAEHVGSVFRDIFEFGAGSEIEDLMLAVARDRKVHAVVVERSPNPKYPTRALAAKAFPLAGGRVGIAIDDITHVIRARRLQDAEHRVLEMIASGAELPALLDAIALAIEEHAPPMLASILLLDSDGVHVRHGAAPHLPAAYIQRIDGEPIGPRAGSCGTAAYERRPVFVEDIATDPRWADYREVAAIHGLRACWSTPILATNGRVLGTFALYHRETRSPTQEDFALLARATHLAGIAIEQRQLEQQLRDLSAHVESVREDERSGIAREIHDELGQALTALKMDLAWLARRISGGASGPDEKLLEMIKSMSLMTDEIIQQIRRISSDLRPSVLDDLGLLAAIEWYSSEFERRTGTPCEVESNLADTQLPRELATAAFRIFQEALTNVARHAEATHVGVRFGIADGRLCVEVRDNGKGIAERALRSPKSLGLLGIHERARRLGGKVSVGPGQSGGTVVSLELPLAGETS